MQIVTANESWGFFGTLQSNNGVSVREAADLFNRAGQHLIARGFVRDAEQAVAFLDSRYGRHFADALSFHVALPAPSVESLAGAVAIELANSEKSWRRSIKAAL
jgi:hypothetical protein